MTHFRENKDKKEFQAMSATEYCISNSEELMNEF